MARHQLHTVSAIEALTDGVRKRVLTGELPAGTAVGEEELASDFGVARPTARAAIQSLVQAGVLRREPYRSAYVPVLTAADVRDLFFVRTPLEVRVVGALSERGLQLPAADEAVRRMESLPPDARWGDVVDADASFHDALVAAAGSPRLHAVYAQLRDEIRLALIQLEPVQDSISTLGVEHRRILDAIARGSADVAMRLMGEHLDQAVADLTGAET